MQRTLLSVCKACWLEVGTVAPRIFTPHISSPLRQIAVWCNGQGVDFESEFCVQAVPGSNPAVVGFGFSITIRFNGSRHMTFKC